jgi:hypothetical protein
MFSEDAYDSDEEMNFHFHMVKGLAVYNFKSLHYDYILLRSVHYFWKVFN